MDVLESYRDMQELLHIVGAELWTEARKACNHGPRWVVLVASAEEARLLALPEGAARVEQTRSGQAFAMALPVEQVIRSFAVLGPNGDLAEMWEEAIHDHPSSDNECAFVVANRGWVSLIWAGPDSRAGILGIGRA